MNKELAMTLLRSKLYDLQVNQQNAELGKLRNDQIGAGKRSEKIRTYNWKDGRCTDHRLNENFPLSICLSGNFEDIHEQCALHHYHQQHTDMDIDIGVLTKK